MAEKVKNETAASKETAVKTNTAAKEPAATAKKTPEQQIYAGPTIPKHGLFHWAVFRGGLPAFVDAVLKEHPWAGALFVPIADLADAKRQLADSASPLTMLGERLKKTLEAKKEG